MIPFCDWLSVTHHPGDSEELKASVRDVLLDSPCISSLGDGSRYTYEDGGAARWIEKDRFGIFAFSGGCLTALRGAGLYVPLLHALGVVPTKVTRIDIAVDVPEPSPPVLRRLYRDGRRGRLSLSRKAVAPTSVQKRIGPAEYDPSQDTGTVYLGQRGVHRVFARVYDKRQETLQRYGRDIGHPLTRYEVEAHKSGATLRDAWDPESMFWHYMADVLPAPDGVPPWVPGGQGISLPPLVRPDPASRLRRFVEEHADVFRQLLALGDATCAPGSPHGRAYALQLVRALGSPLVPLGAAEAASAVPPSATVVAEG